MLNFCSDDLGEAKSILISLETCERETQQVQTTAVVSIFDIDQIPSTSRQGIVLDEESLLKTKNDSQLSLHIDQRKFR